MMLLASIFLVSLCTGLSYGVIHDYYTGEVVTKKLMTFYKTNNLIDTCTIDVKPCDENEWRRIDGSCNSLKHPAMGTFLTPLKRLLPAHYYNGYEQRKALSGKELPLARVVRLKLLNQAQSSHDLLNHNVPGFGIYKFFDIGSVHDIENMLRNTTYCCENEHMNDKECTPNIILDDDPVFRYSSIRCMNSTRPLTHQSFNCTRDEVPSVIKKATTPYDESQIYNAKGKGDKVLRTFKNGMLLLEEEDGKLFPPNGPTAYCANNVAPDETRCFENYWNNLLPANLFIIWFVRHHNYIASKLAGANPCWEDDMLFYVAREINSAYSNQMYFYEWNLAVQGRDNLIKFGIITEDGGFRDLYDDTKYPEVTLEYTYVMRYWHLMQESTAKLYDKNGHFVKDYPLFNATFRSGLIAKNVELFTQSTFRAPCHGIDGTVSYDIANRGLPGVQEALDVTAGDLNKGRNFGLAPYIDYIHHFTGVNITCFEDLEQFIPPKYIEKLKDLYEDVHDIDVMAGWWCERLMEGGNIPLTVAHVLNDNMFRAMKTDRHWYERKNRPHAFTEGQLQQIRKATLALMLCNVGDGVNEITKNAFFKISPENPLVPCSAIQTMDFSAWADDACNVDAYLQT